MRNIVLSIRPYFGNTIKRIICEAYATTFVLSFAMVCTLLAGVNVVAFAADDDTETVPVFKFYNDAKKGGDGEHLFTKDAEEMSWLSSLKTWNNEGEAWQAPVTSSEAVYRCYNPNSGEHLYVDEGYADYLDGIGWDKEKVAFYSDDNMGVPVYRLWNGQDGVGSHHFTTDEGEVEWLEGQGWIAEDVAFFGVKEEYSDVVQLVDMEGLQSDGTALTTDTLQVIFGSELGVPASVAWYKDGAVVKVITSRLDESSFKLGKNSNGYGTAEELKPGIYYAVVTNSDGKTFKTNLITVSDESAAKITDVSINDNFGVLENIKADKTKMAAEQALMPFVNQKTPNVVVNAKVNKDYDGNAYLVEDKDDYTVLASDKINMTIYDEEDEPTGNTLVVSKKNFTDAYLSDAFGGLGIVNTAGQIKALALQNTDGSVEYKFLATLRTTDANGLERGKDYKVVYDQDGTAEGKKVKELNASNTATCPYLIAPTSVEVTDVQSDTSKPGWTLTLKTGDMDSVWVNAGLGAGSKVTATLYTDDDDDEDGTLFNVQPDAIVAGVAKDTTGTGCAGIADQSYIYGEFTAEKGIFGPEAISLVSDVIAVPDEIAASATLTQVESDPTSFKLDVSKLRGNATAFLLGGSCDPADTDNAQNTQEVMAYYVSQLTDEAEFVDMARLEKGKTVTATFENAVTEFANEESATTKGDVYFVVIVPDDTSDYATTGSLPVQLKQEISAIRFVQSVAQKSFSGSTITVAGAVRGMDQFLDDMDYSTTSSALTRLLEGNVPGVKVQFEQKSVASSAYLDPEFVLTVASVTQNDGDLEITGKAGFEAYQCSKGDTYEYKLSPFQTLVLTCVDKGNGTVGTAKWTLTIK